MSRIRRSSAGALVALAALLAGCTVPPAHGGPTASAGTGADAPADAGPPSCKGDLPPYDPKALAARVAWLAAPERAGRVPGTGGDRAARAHVLARFKCLGLAASEQPFTDAAGRETANVIAVLPGRDAILRDEVILVGAHLDHTGDGHLGANDNASGVAALLAVAQLLAERPAASAPRRTVVFVAFGAEELGLAGSRHLAAHPPATLPLANLVYMVNLDMVGAYASAGTVYALGAFKKTPARGFLDARDAGARAALSVTPGAAGKNTSDHAPFCDLGVPYLFFWTPDARCYHQACDTADRVDHAGLAAIAALTGDLVSHLADTDEDLAAHREKSGCKP